MEEGLAKFNLAPSVFFNPHMELCRDLCSLAISALPELVICDGMSGTGIRGIRYALENENVKSVTFIDSSESACELIKENLTLNKINFDVILDDFNHQMYRGGRRYNFIEIDPFGSPIPFVRSALFNLRTQKEAFLSVTATDAAVLCGAQPGACRVYYCAKPLNNFFCHETAVRILIGYIAKVASSLKVGVEPIFTFAKRHWIKVILRTKKGTKEALNTITQLGYVTFCTDCFAIRTNTNPFLNPRCDCGSNVNWAGPLWLGKILDRDVVEKMIKSNSDRNYKNKKQLNTLLDTLKEEANGPSFYFDIHAICKNLRTTVPKIDKVINALRMRGFFATRTSFRPNSIRTDASSSEISEVVRSLR